MPVSMFQKHNAGLEHFPANLDRRDGADFGPVQGEMAQECVDLSRHLDAAMGQNRPAPHGLGEEVRWQRCAACRGNQPLPHAAPRQRTSSPNHGDPGWSESALVMGKHEVINSSSRVARHRAAMRAKGLRLRQIWEPNPYDPAFLSEIARANRAIAAHPEKEASVLAWIEAMTTGVIQEIPDYKW